MTQTEIIVALAAPVLAIITYLIGQAILAMVRHQDQPRVERESILVGSERAVGIMSVALTEQRSQVEVLAAELAEALAENERLRSQISDRLRSPVLESPAESQDIPVLVEDIAERLRRIEVLVRDMQRAQEIALSDARHNNHREE